MTQEVGGEREMKTCKHCGKAVAPCGRVNADHWHHVHGDGGGGHNAEPQGA